MADAYPYIIGFHGVQIVVPTENLHEEQSQERKEGWRSQQAMFPRTQLLLVVHAMRDCSIATTLLWAHMVAIESGVRP